MPSASDVARISSAAQSDVGRTRTENQDAFGEFSTPSGERLFVVADGMGGHRGGATASRLCVETIGRTFSDGSDPAQDRLRRGFEIANARIHAAAESDHELAGMGTTAVALVLATDGTGVLVWVGDSRAYRFSGGALERLSTDHSVVGEMIRAGVITEEEAESHPRRNELLRAIGPHDFVEPETLELRHSPGDRFLLCSDGLWGPVPEAELAIVLGFETPELAVKKLIAKANERGGPDNVTAQIASVAEPGVELPLAAPDVDYYSRPEPASRSRTLVLLASGAAVAAAALIALAVYSVRKSEVDQIMAAAEKRARALEAPTPTEASPTAPTQAAPPAEVVAAKARPAEPKQEGPKAIPPAPVAEAAKPRAAKPPPEKPVVAKLPAQKPVAAKTPAQKPVAAKPAAEKSAAVTPVLEKPEPEKAVVPPAPATSAAVEALPAEPTPAPAEAPAPAPAQESTPQALSRLEVEQFLLDWETAISSKDFALYSRLGLPGNEQTFKTHYVENEAKVDFALRDFGQSDPDELVVRVQMVLETQDPTGTRRVDEERRFVVKQTPGGLRYIGLPKN